MVGVRKAEAERCIDSFYQFLRHFWHTINSEELEDNWHLHYLCGKLQKYGEQIRDREDALPDCIINVSPGTTKSTIVSQMFNAWLWLHAPWACVISSSYSYDLSRGHSAKTKEIILSEQYQTWYQSYFKIRFGKYLKFKKNTERVYENNFGGFRYATGTDGAVMGRHAHVILIDDPMNMRQSESEAYRKKANTFSVGALSTRKKNKKKTPTIMVMQCLHAMDTTGYMIEKAKEKNKKIDHIVLPAKLSDNLKPKKLAKYYVNGYFDANRMSQEVLDEAKVDLGSFGFAGQFMQRPSPEDGGKVKREWWQYVDRKDLPADLVWHKMIDGAYTKNTKNDPTGIMTYAFDEDTKTIYVLHWESAHREMPQLIKRLKETWKQPEWSHESKHYIEPKATGHTLAQYIKEDVSQTAVLLTDKMTGKLVSDGKEARLQKASPKIEAGQVILVRGHWNDAFIQEICGFPNEEHDEAVDCIGYACGKHFKTTRRKGTKHRQ